MNEIIESIRKIIDTAEKFRSAYFWSSPSCAASRRWMEKQNSVSEITWDEGGHTYTASYSVTCSCKNVYASGYYTKDGKKTTLTAIKNSYKRLTEGRP